MKTTIVITLTVVLLAAAGWRDARAVSYWNFLESIRLVVWSAYLIAVPAPPGDSDDIPIDPSEPAWGSEASEASALPEMPEQPDPPPISPAPGKWDDKPIFVHPQFQDP